MAATCNNKNMVKYNEAYNSDEIFLQVAITIYVRKLNNRKETIPTSRDGCSFFFTQILKFDTIKY